MVVMMIISCVRARTRARVCVCVCVCFGVGGVFVVGGRGGGGVCVCVCMFLASVGPPRVTPRVVPLLRLHKKDERDRGAASASLQATTSTPPQAHVAHGRASESD